jgi:hypothetical protein
MVLSRTLAGLWSLNEATMAVGRTDDPRVADAGPAVDARRAVDAGPAVDGLLTRVARGDVEALGDVFDQVASSVYGLVNRTVGDQERSERVTEEVLLEVWRTASRFSPSESSGLAWIIAIAQRRAHAAGRTVSRFGAPEGYG